MDYLVDDPQSSINIRLHYQITETTKYIEPISEVLFPPDDKNNIKFPESEKDVYHTEVMIQMIDLAGKARYENEACRIANSECHMIAGVPVFNLAGKKSPMSTPNHHKVYLKRRYLGQSISVPSCIYTFVS